jgi:hypothetical protein
MESSGVSVLRTFRLLRILKLVRFMPALRRQLIIMLKTIDNVATFFSLLCLFIFIFSILGMNLFGCKFCTKDENGNRLCERKNFDSLLWAIITVFQVLTQEDWNEVLYNGMERTSSWAALYFIALMTFGNYVLFNLLVAILVEGFSTEDEPKKSLAERIKEDALHAIVEEAYSKDHSQIGGAGVVAVGSIGANLGTSHRNSLHSIYHNRSSLPHDQNHHHKRKTIARHSISVDIVANERKKDLFLFNKRSKKSVLKQFSSKLIETLFYHLPTQIILK